jgi:predicted DNA-binding transcriptional regulator AlpA
VRIRSSVSLPAYAHGVASRYRADELVGVAEIAERLGVGTSVVHDWTRRHTDFPSPVLTLRMGFVFAWPEVERWAKKTGRA